MAIQTRIKDVEVHIGDEVKVTTLYRDQPTGQAGADKSSESGDKLKKQIFAGMVIAIKNAGENKSFTVRKMSASGVGIERIFPVAWPMMEKIEVVRNHKIRRAKLYYMRSRIGKAAQET